MNPEESLLSATDRCAKESPMKKKILLAFWTTDGHARSISERIASRLESNGAEVRMVCLRDEQPDPGGYDGVIVGASIRYGFHHPKVERYVNRHTKALDAVPNAFFSINLSARKPVKSTPETNPYCRKFLQKIKWKPGMAVVFPGKVDFTRYRGFDRVMMHLIMSISGGPHGKDTVVDFTDWNAVDAFSDRFAEGCSLEKDQ